MTLFSTSSHFIILFRFSIMYVSYLDEEEHVLKWVKKTLSYSFLLVESISGGERNEPIRH